MPLSEHEQRMLRQIERQFQQERGLARPLRMPAGPREATRNAKRAAVVFVVGLVALLVSFASSWLLGLVGFIAMLASAVVLVQSLRRLAQDRLDHVRSGGELHAREGRRGRQPKWWPGGGPRREQGS